MLPGRDSAASPASAAAVSSGPLSSAFCNSDRSIVSLSAAGSSAGIASAAGASTGVFTAETKVLSAQFKVLAKIRNEITPVLEAAGIDGDHIEGSPYEYAIPVNLDCVAGVMEGAEPITTTTTEATTTEATTTEEATTEAATEAETTEAAEEEATEAEEGEALDTEAVDEAAAEDEAATEAEIVAE